MKCVILAAGQGVRLLPLTTNRSKHMLLVAGKPLLEHLLESLIGSGFNDFILVVGYQQEIIKKHFGDGCKLNAHIEYVTQPCLSGTAKAIESIKERVPEESFAVVYGDLILAKSAIGKVLRKYEESQHSMVIALVRVTDPSSYGIASVSGDDLIDIVEKPDLGSAPTNLAFAGVGIFNESIFSALEATRLSSRGEFEITDSIKAMLSRGYSVKCSILSVEEWLDVGRPWDLLEANERLLKSITSQVEGEVDESVSLEGSVVVSKKARIRRGSVIEGPVWIGESSEIGPYAHIRAYSTIGRRVHVGNFCEVKNSIVMDGSRIPHLSYIGDSIIGERCNLGAGTITANLRLDEKPIRMLVKGELIETGLRKLGVIMGDDVKTGINVSIMPGVKIRSGAFVAAGEVVARDIERA